MDNTDIKDAILVAALVDIPFDGWTIDVFRKAAEKAGHEIMVVDAVFPRGIHDTLAHFSAWADRQMTNALARENIETLRIRDKVAHALETRITVLTPYKDCVRESARLMAQPRYTRLGAQITWNCADTIWNWVGDTSTDYNRYTKRGLLSAVIGATMIYWLQDESDNNEKTVAFIRRRIDNVLFLGKNAGRVIKPVASLFERFIVPSQHKKSGSDL